MWCVVLDRDRGSEGLCRDIDGGHLGHAVLRPVHHPPVLLALHRCHGIEAVVHVAHRGSLSGQALQPNIDFMALRWPMRLFSAGLVAASLLLVSMRGADLLDTEFRGGVSIVMETKPEGEDRLMLARAEVEQEIRALASEISTADVDPLTADGQRALILSQLGSAAVVTVGETSADAEGNTTACLLYTSDAADE